MKIKSISDYLKDRAYQVNRLFILGYTELEIMERLQITSGEYHGARKILKKIAQGVRGLDQIEHLKLQNMDYENWRFTVEQEILFRSNLLRELKRAIRKNKREIKGILKTKGAM